MQDQQRPEYPEYQNYYGPRRPQKKHTGLLVILVILALLTGAASWAVNFLGMEIDIHEHGISLAIGKAKDSPADPSAKKAEAAASPSLSQEAAVPAPIVKDSPEDTALDIRNSPPSVETRPSDDPQALSLQAIYEKVIPSVASISCIHTNSTGTGTGIILTADGYIVTNYHVIEGAQQIYVLLSDNQTYSAAVVGGDEITDLAVLKLEAEGLQPAQFGDSDMLRVGDSVVAIGDPLGTELRGTMTDGIVSAINRDLNLSGRQMTLIQTNAALNSGNSGGPLINCYGQVIGINTMKMSSYSSTSATVEGLGFAIPVSAAKPIVEELILQGYVSGRPALGISGMTLDLRTQFFYRLPSGVIITGILEDSDAAAKGLSADDVIVSFDEHTVNSLEDLVRAKADKTAGDIVTLTIYRGGQYYRVDVELMDQINPEIY